MSASENRQIVAEVMAERAKGNARPFGEAMTEDCIWRQMGAQGRWSVAYEGRRACWEQLFAPLRKQYATPCTNTPVNILADAGRAAEPPRRADRTTALTTAKTATGASAGHGRRLSIRSRVVVDQDALASARSMTA